MTRAILIAVLILLATGAAQAEPARRAYTIRPYANSPAGDWADGEDPLVRQAAVEALGRLNGSIVVADAQTGQILSMVNQKLALSDGYIPCSTIKLVAGLAALSEGLIEPAEKVYFPGGWFMTMVHGLAISNNVLFDELGERLGFGRFRRYARWLGFGEKAGWNIPGEQIGNFPAVEHDMGVGRMTSFGDGISVTPLQLAAFVSSIANGGSLYYLQHPEDQSQATALSPRLKRHLAIGDWLPEIEKGMAEAVRTGTAKRARASGTSVWGKTGTCSVNSQRSRTRLGWFASFARDRDRTLTIVVMLRGGASISGSLASEVGGNVLQRLRRSELAARHPELKIGRLASQSR
ncbi:MAG: penicillin-binding transpeptidase domain-containing protein [Acidobacteria bacterium]|nr:penicillin-binding transpeptidase domain-containing protein [Acidobacteriota bacterium]MDA1235022.1 penicillin-binding transpeptidase domain-containing protein [Acidobacteriota bacterium]